jgi:hypothetical protein
MDFSDFNLLDKFMPDSGKPYDDAMAQFQKYFEQARQMQQPFYQAGVNALPQMQDWLSKMKDPSAFINNINSQYQESPFAKFQQQQGIRAANNLGSANGLIDSTPLQMQAQQNAQNISSQDQNNWLQHVLGVNTQYGNGLGNLTNMGSNSANILTQLMSQMGGQMGGAAMGRGVARNNDWYNNIGMLAQLAAFL